MGDGLGANRIYFNRDAEQAYKIREWYVEFHPTISGSTAHEFQPDWLGVMAILSACLFEIKDMTGLTQTGRALAERHEYYAGLLIDADGNKADEELKLEVYFDGDIDGLFAESEDNPYDWV